MRLPRDLSGDDLIKLLRRYYGYRTFDKEAAMSA